MKALLGKANKWLVVALSLPARKRTGTVKGAGELLDVAAMA